MMGPTRHKAFQALQQMMRAAKRKWAHNLLHEAADSADIWHMATIRKGR